MNNSIVATSQDTDLIKIVKVKRRGQSDILLPLDANENKKLLQMEAANLSSVLNEFTEKFKADVKTPKGQPSNVTPLQLKQLTEAIEKSHAISRAAWGETKGDGSNGSDDASELAKDVASIASMISKSRAKQEKPIDAETEDVT